MGDACVALGGTTIACLRHITSSGAGGDHDRVFKTYNVFWGRGGRLRRPGGDHDRVIETYNLRRPLRNTRHVVEPHG